MFMDYLTNCHSSFESQVVIHLAVPANLTTLKIDEKILRQFNSSKFTEVWKMKEKCPEAKSYMIYLLSSFPTTDIRKLAYKEVYPQNHMRNIARKGCGTHWTYSADVDILPRDGMADMLQQFYKNLERNGELCKK